jgi:hypothetical protein
VVWAGVVRLPFNGIWPWRSERWGSRSCCATSFQPMPSPRRISRSIPVLPPSLTHPPCAGTETKSSPSDHPTTASVEPCLCSMPNHGVELRSLENPPQARGGGWRVGAPRYCEFQSVIELRRESVVHCQLTWSPSQISVCTPRSTRRTLVSLISWLIAC